MHSNRQRLEERVRRVLPAAGIIILLVVYFLHALPDRYLVEKVKYVGMLLMSVLLMLLFVCLCFQRLCNRILCTLYRDRETAGKRIAALATIALASVTHRVLLRHPMDFHTHMFRLPLNIRPDIIVLLVLTLVALLFFIRVPRSYTPIFILALIWGVLLRLMVLHAVPFDPEDADMLYCINRSCDSLLHGVNPYGQTYFVNPSHWFPLVYFPLLWLPYLPFQALSVDLRWFNLFAQLALFGFVWFLIGRNNRSAARSLVLVFLILMPDMIWAFFYEQMSHYWLLGSVYLWLVWRERWNLSLLAVCGLVLMRITALTSLGIYIIYVWKRRGPRIAMMDASIAAAALVLSLAPFAGVGIARFEYVFYSQFLEWTGKMGWQLPLRNLAIGGILGRLGLGHVIVPLQVGGLLVMGLLYRHSRDQSYHTFAGLTALAYVYFLWVANYVYIYYWFLPVLFLSTLYLIETRETGVEPVRDSEVSAMRLSSQPICSPAKPGLRCGSTETV